MTAATPAACGHEHGHGGIAYRCERAPHSTAGHEERRRHAARIDAGYAREIGDVDDQGTPDLLTWEGDEDGDGDNTEVAWGSVAGYGNERVNAAPGQAHEADPPSACFSRVFLGRSDFACGGTPGHAGKHGYRLPWVTVEWDGKDAVPQPSTQAAGVAPGQAAPAAVLASLPRQWEAEAAVTARRDAAYASALRDCARELRQVLAGIAAQQPQPAPGAQCGTCGGSGMLMVPGSGNHSPGEQPCPDPVHDGDDWFEVGDADAGTQPAPELAATGRPTTSLEDAMLRNIDGLNDLVRDMLQSFPDTADEQEWRDRAGALNVCDPDGQPYRAITEEDL